MSIILIKDDIGPPLERCCFCRTQTQYWSKARDVAVCEPCADIHEEVEVPSKKEWCSKEAELTRKPWNN